jgi:SSS family solute:Na+ symporter
MLATFTGYDWGIVIVYIIIGSLPGFLLRKYIRGQAEFLVAGRTLSVFLATATLTATELGLVTVMYFAQQAFTVGFSAFVIGLIAFVTTMFIGLTGFMVAGLRVSEASGCLAG